MPGRPGAATFAGSSGGLSSTGHAAPEIFVAPMLDRTITALYDTKAAAEAAKQRLGAMGVSSADIHDEGSANSMNSTPAGAKSTGGVLGGLKSMFGAHEDTHAYTEGLKRGHLSAVARSLATWRQIH